ncbi:hypothetical protein BDW22DRAFT_1349365 [Trametopsis cervina]|nr:hypothetical protein BDW22DRAFT_1349365 [Trametopsis cervina]
MDTIQLNIHGAQPPLSPDSRVRVSNRPPFPGLHSIWTCEDEGVEMFAYTALQDITSAVSEISCGTTRSVIPGTACEFGFRACKATIATGARVNHYLCPRSPFHSYSVPGTPAWYDPAHLPSSGSLMLHRIPPSTRLPRQSGVDLRYPDVASQLSSHALAPRHTMIPAVLVRHPRGDAVELGDNRCQRDTDTYDINTSRSGGDDSVGRRNGVRRSRRTGLVSQAAVSVCPPTDVSAVTAFIGTSAAQASVALVKDSTRGGESDGGALKTLRSRVLKDAVLLCPVCDRDGKVPKPTCESILTKMQDCYNPPLKLKGGPGHILYERLSVWYDSFKDKTRPKYVLHWLDLSSAQSIGAQETQLKKVNKQVSKYQIDTLSFPMMNDSDGCKGAVGDAGPIAKLRRCLSVQDSEAGVDNCKFSR